MDLPANFGKEWTDVDLQTLYQHLAGARSVAESARDLGRSEGEVVRKVREVAAKMFMEGFMTKDAVANATGLTVDQVDSAVREYDIMHRRAQETLRPHTEAVAAPAPAQTQPVHRRERQQGAGAATPLAHLAATISKSLKDIVRALDEYVEGSN